MEELIKKFKKIGTSALLNKVDKLKGDEQLACIEVLKSRDQDVSKWMKPEELEKSEEAIVYKADEELTPEEEAIIEKAESKLAETQNETKNEEAKKQTPASMLKETLTKASFPEGFSKDDVVSFLASKRSPKAGEKLVGKLKRYFFDKQGNCFYFAIDVDGKEYCKRPDSVTKENINK